MFSAFKPMMPEIGFRHTCSDTSAGKYCRSRFLWFVWLAILVDVATLPALAETRGVAAIPEVDSDARASFGDYHAVIIGINDYQSNDWPNLEYAEKDAREIRDILVNNYGFAPRNVIHLEGSKATRGKILNAISGKIETLGKNDNLLIYYAGHGQVNPVTEEGYWIPVEGDSYDDVTWISFGRVRKLVEASKADAKRIALITDSCYGGALTTRSGPTPGHTAPEIAGYDVYAAKLEKQVDRKSRQVIASGGYEEVPDKSEFAQLLKNALRNNQWPMIDIEVLYYHIGSSLSLQGLQDPAIERLVSGQDWDGQFVLLRSDTGSQDSFPESAANEAKITFLNSSDVTVEVFYVTADGQEFSSYELQPDQSYVQRTSIGHAWRVKNKKTGQILKQVAASGVTQQVSITADPVAASPRDALKEKLVGSYENHQYDKGGKNAWHYVKLEDADKNRVRWSNRAGVSWTLSLTEDRTVLLVGQENPYFASGYRRARVEWNANGTVKRIQGPGNEWYDREPRPAAVAASPTTRTCAVDAGPIWNQRDAQNKCPRTCRKSGAWTGHWWTTVPNKMSVCQCSGCPQ